MKRARSFFASLDRADYVALVGSVIFGLVGSIISVVRYWQYEAYYIDFGIFDQAIWNVSRFQAPIIEHFIVGGKWIFADHFNPSIFLLSPLYWITDQSEIILIAQAAIVGISGFVLYKISREVTKHSGWSLALLFSYFSFVGLQNAVITEFHELTIMTLSLSLAWWFVIKKKKLYYFLFLIITLGFKEALFPLGVGLGIAILLLQKEWRREGIVTIAISLIWGLVAIKFIIPFFSGGGDYIYSPQFPQGITNIVANMINEPDKRKTLLYSFASFGFLPLFSLPFSFALLQDYALRFLPEGFGTRWTLGLHYNAQSAVLLFLSSIYSVRTLLKNNLFNKYSLILCGMLVLFAFGLNRFVLRGPFHLVYNPAFYAHTKNFKFLDDLIALVPKESSVMTQNNIAGHFTHQKVYLLTPNYAVLSPEYIVFDMRDGQGPTNFFGIPRGHTPESILEVVEKDPGYEVYYQKDDQYIFKKRNAI